MGADTPIGAPGGRLPLKACLYCLKCTEVGQLILRRIIKIVATRCQILRLKCTKFDFGWSCCLGRPHSKFQDPPVPADRFIK